MIQSSPYLTQFDYLNYKNHWFSKFIFRLFVQQKVPKIWWISIFSKICYELHSFMCCWLSQKSAGLYQNRFLFCFFSWCAWQVKCKCRLGTPKVSLLASADFLKSRQGIYELERHWRPNALYTFQVFFAGCPNKFGNYFKALKITSKSTKINQNELNLAKINLIMY